MSASQEEGIAKEINLTARELADLIWLMVQIKPSSELSGVSPLPTRVDSQNAPSSPKNNEIPDVPQGVEPVEQSTPIYPESLPSRASKPASIPGVPLEIADPLALRNALALGRSLRPLMRKVPSSTEMVLDEEATVTKIAEVEAAREDFWLPVFQPVPSRWLEVALVVEETQRSLLWRQMLAEFQSLLERQGAFRTVSLWRLKIGSPGEVQLHAKNRQASLKELNDPSGRRLIWVVSDCVSSMWHDGSVLKVLRDWGKTQPVSLLQLLPERLWQRTALGWGTEVQLSSDNPGVPNARLFTELASRGILLDFPGAFALPVVTLEAVPLKNWAKVLAGVGGSRTPGLVFLPEEIGP
jgi:hypothetical protein